MTEPRSNRGPIEADLCVIGAGAAGLSVAAGAVQMGARVVLIERGEMGGDCLNVGCVPSKALLAAGARAAAPARASGFGLSLPAAEIDFAAVQRHVAEVIGAIAPHDSQERFEGLGVQVIRAEARFLDRERLEAGGAEIRARRYVIATGSRPAIPPIPGLAETPHLTNETIFGLRERPRALLVLGGGPVGVELALAHRRLGVETVLIERETLLAREDPEAVAVVRAALAEEGVRILETAEAMRVERSGEGGVALTLASGERVEGSHLLVATGRRPAVDGLGLEAAGVAHGPAGIETDARLRTSNRRIFAIGDVAQGPGAGRQFTHVAGYHAGIVIRNALFRLPAKASLASCPRVVYASPELAQVGMTEAEARAAQGDRVTVIRTDFAENDRARTERETAGFVKAIFGRRGRILGATIVGAQAGELILPWTLAMSAGLGAKQMAGVIAPYPTRGEASKRVAGQYYAPSLFSPRTRWVVRTLFRLLG